MDKGYLEDYEQREQAEYDRLADRIREGRFAFGKESFPPDRRFVKLQKPVALAAVLDVSKVGGLMNNVSCDTSIENNLYAQIPFCGSLVLPIPTLPQSWFERFFFKASEIPEIIDFIKESGRLQVVLADFPSRYAGLDHP